MDDGSQTTWLIVLLLLVAAMVFAVAETAFASVSRIRLRTEAEKGDARAKRALYVTEHFNKAITTLLICTNIVHLATAYATLTWLLVTQAQVGRAHEFKVVHRPHHAAAALLGEFRQHGRQVGMDVVQVHDVGIEIIEDLAESALDVAPSHEPLGCT